MIKIVSQSQYTPNNTDKRSLDDHSRYSIPFQIQDSNCYHHSRNREIQHTLTDFFISDNKEEGTYESKEYSKDKQQCSPHKTQRLQLLNEKERINSIQVQQKDEFLSMSHSLQQSSPNNPIDKKIWLKCIIERRTQQDKDTYLLFTSKDKKYFLQAIKISKGKFNITSCKTPNKQFGVMKRNFIGTQFSLYTDYDSSKRDKCNNICSIIYVRLILYYIM